MVQEFHGLLSINAIFLRFELKRESQKLPGWVQMMVTSQLGKTVCHHLKINGLRLKTDISRSSRVIVKETKIPTLFMGKIQIFGRKMMINSRENIIRSFILLRFFLF